MRAAPWSRPAVVVLWALTVTLVAAHLVRPTGVVGDTTYLLAIGAAPVVAWLGTSRARRGARLVPTLISAGLTASALGDVIWVVIAWRGQDPDVSVADIAYLASYLGLGAAMLVITLVRGGGVTRVDVDAVIDALTVVVVSVLVLWSVSVRDIVADESVSATTRVVWAVYPVADRAGGGRESVAA